MNKLAALLQSGKPILLDGAMGTMLFAAGLESGHSPEEWNVLHPEKVRAIHRAYIEAGSQVILTNTFGGSAVRLESHGLAERVHELNEAAAKNARAEADAVERTVVVAGSIGPTGQLLEPLGTLTREEARKSFAAQAGWIGRWWCGYVLDRNHVRSGRGQGRHRRDSVSK